MLSRNRLKISPVTFGIIGHYAPSLLSLELLMLHRLETPLLVVTDPTHPIGTEIDTIKVPEKQSGMITLRACDVRTYIPEIPKQPLTGNFITKNKSIRGGSPREWGEQKYKKKRTKK